MQAPWTLPHTWKGKLSQSKGRWFFWLAEAPDKPTWTPPLWTQTLKPWSCSSESCKDACLTALKTLWNVKDTLELDGQSFVTQVSTFQKDCISIAFDEHANDLFPFARVERRDPGLQDPLAPCVSFWKDAHDERPRFPVTERQMELACKDKFEIVQSQRLSEALLPVFDWAFTDAERQMRDKLHKKFKKHMDVQDWQFVAMLRVWHLRVKK